MRTPFCAILVFFLTASGVEAHTIHYRVENKGISVRLFYSPEDPVNYSQYEVFGPGDKIPHQKGRTDRNGVVSFLPDRPGTWLVKVWGESDHGYHGTQIKVKVDENLFLESFKKPLVATHTKILVGMAFILGIFGIWGLLKMRKKADS